MEEPSSPLERIYIGGLDPHRLSVEQVVDRLKSTKGLKVVSFDECSNSDYPATFFFVNVVLLRTNDDADPAVMPTLKSKHHKDKEDANDQHQPTAREILAAQYNNVRWKGCRLRIESAKPHFLQRLAEEIRERKEERQTKQQTLESKLLSNELQLQLQQERNDGRNSNNSSNIPRNLRIRRRRGEETYKVDTKPRHFVMHINDHLYPSARTSTSAKSNDAIRDEKCSLRPGRAVHIIFDYSIERHDLGPQDGRPMDQSHLTNHDQSDSESEDSDSDSDSDEHLTSGDSDDEGSTDKSVENMDGSVVSPQRTKYLWSDDEGADNDSISTAAEEANARELSSESEDSTTTGTESLGAKQVSLADSDEEKNCKIESSVPHIEDAGNTRTFVEEKEQSEKYHWTDDSSSQSDLSNGKERNQCNSFGSDWYDKDVVNLEHDVSNNMNVLAQLFPDMQERVTDLSRSKKSDSDEAAATTVSGWEKGSYGKAPLMQRYDPTSASAKRFELESKQDHTQQEGEQTKKIDLLGSDEGHLPAGETGDKESERMESLLDKEQTHSMQIDNTEGASDAKGQIYEEKKLETIFQQQSLKANQGASSFQFFDSVDNVEDDGDAAEQGASATNPGFSFSFALESSDKQDTLVSSNEPERTTTVNEMKETGDQIYENETTQERTVELKRRKGLFFPQDVLDQWEDDFFAFNGGIERIVANSEEDRNAWEEKRRTLTLDWKRKHQKAVSKLKQKRIRM